MPPKPDLDAGRGSRRGTRRWSRELSQSKIACVLASWLIGRTSSGRRMRRMPSQPGERRHTQLSPCTWPLCHWARTSIVEPHSGQLGIVSNAAAARPRVVVISIWTS
jgi:hypothetical protein